MTDYKSIVQHYEDCLQQHGDNHLGVDWPRKEDAETRYRVMLDLEKFDPKSAGTKYPSLLDFGCGAAHLLGYMQQYGYNHWVYQGMDLSAAFIDLCRQKFPGTTFYCADVLGQNDIPLTGLDYIVMNGVLTEKRTLSFQEMWDYTQNLLARLFPLVSRGLAFNVMSKEVDWERDDLFHLSKDLLGSFLSKELSRNYIIRNDYGLYEYTVYLYH